MTLERVLWECFRHFVRHDETMMPVRYSPLTIAVAEQLDDRRILYGHLDGIDDALLDAVLATVAHAGR